MKTTRRSLLAGMVLAGAAPPLVACGEGSDDTAIDEDSLSPVNVGYIPGYNGASVVAVADEQELWAKHGLKANVEAFANGPLQVEALNAGELDIAYIGPGALWLPATGNGRIIAVNSVTLADRVVAQPGVTSVEGLWGKKVAVPEGTSGDMILRLALDKADMTSDDIKRVLMDPDEIVEAFGAGEITGAGLWYPLVDTIKAEVPDLVEVASSEDFYPTTTFPSVFLASNQVAATDTELISKVLGVIREANDFRESRPDKAIEITSAYIDLEVTDLTAESATIKLFKSADLDMKTSDGTIEAWLSSVNKLFVDFGRIPEGIDPADYYLGKLYQDAG